MSFPNNFIWSAATSAYQFEGASNIDGKGLSVQDIKNKDNGYFDIAMDHYHHYKEDISLLAKLGLKGYRFSIAWSRILPNGDGEVNKNGIAFYKNLILECKKYNILPIVTLFHDDMPYSLALKGGWNNRDIIDSFLHYCNICFQEFGQDVAYWQPICEQNLLTIEYIVKQKGTFQQAFQANHHMFLAQAKAFKLFHDLNLPGKIGPALNIVKVYPSSSSYKDMEAAEKMNMIRNLMYLDLAVYGKYPTYALSLLKELNALPIFDHNDEDILLNGTCDYISFSGYTSVCVSENNDDSILDKTGMKYGFNLPKMFKVVPNKNLGYTKFASEVDPVGTRLILIEIYQRYKKPILSIQRGLGLNDTLDENEEINDIQRIDYLRLQIDQLHKTIEDGVDLIGYCTWSAFDVVSTGNGVNKRYGLVYIRRTNENIMDLKRIPKKSYFWFQKLIATNGEIY